MFDRPPVVALEGEGSYKLSIMACPSADISTKKKLDPYLAHHLRRPNHSDGHRSQVLVIVSAAKVHKFDRGIGTRRPSGL